MLQNVTECYGMLRDVTECYGMLRNATECYGMLQQEQPHSQYKDRDCIRYSRSKNNNKCLKF